MANKSTEYRIGTVSKLTGVDPHTIRAWERRYGVLAPRRSDGGTRLYSDEDVQRLRLIKSLTDAGDFIGVVANLDNKQLSERLASLAGTYEKASEPIGQREPLRLAVLGQTLGERCSKGTSLISTEVVAVTESVDALAAALETSSAQMVVAELDLLGLKPRDSFERLKPVLRGRLLVIVYNFARRRLLADLSQRGAKLLHAPSSSGRLCVALRDLHAARQLADHNAPDEKSVNEPAAPLLTSAQLAKLQDLESNVECECPNHLATIVASLVGFEKYARMCIENQPNEAGLHRRLAHGVGHARVQIEQLLLDLCEYDELSI